MQPKLRFRGAQGDYKCETSYSDTPISCASQSEMAEVPAAEVPQAEKEQSSVGLGVPAVPAGRTHEAPPTRGLRCPIFILFYILSNSFFFKFGQNLCVKQPEPIQNGVETILGHAAFDPQEMVRQQALVQAQSTLSWQHSFAQGLQRCRARDR